MEELVKMLDENLEYKSHEIVDGCIYMKIVSARTEVKCPFCAEYSVKTHSTYERSFQDLPIQGMKVTLALNNRKMLCRNSECEHTTFAERFDFISGKSKKTKRLEAEIVRLSLNLSSVTAAKILSQNAVSIGKSTIDLFSRRVVAYGISPKHSTYLITSTMKRALNDSGYPQQLTFHSDQGAQYTSKAFRTLLRVNNIVQSFSRSGKPHDNAVAEAFFSALKKEELYRINFKSEREFYECVDNYIMFYNTQRPHGTLAYKTPERFEELYQQKQKKAS